MGLGIYTFYKGIRSFREYKVLEDTPRMPIRSVPMGFVHIHGKAESAQVLTSPISKTACCFYRVEIDQWKSHDRSHGWEHLCTDADGYKFYVADETGRVQIDAHDAEYDLPPTQERVVDSHAGATAGTAAGTGDSDLLSYVTYAQAHHITDSVSHWLGNKLDQKIEQGSLDPAKQQGLEAFRQLLQAAPNIQKTGQLPVGLIEKVLAARGPLADPDKEARRQFALEHIRQMQSSGTMPAEIMLHQPSQVAQGRFRLREYLVLPGQEYFVSGTCVENSQPQDAHDRNLIAKGQHERTFLISSRPDQQATSAVGKGSLKQVLIGLGLTLGCLALLLWHWNLY
jgi:hypothetical protein